MIIAIALVMLGIMLMLPAVILCFKSASEAEISKGLWWLQFGLISFFLVGYCSVLWLFLRNSAFDDFTQLLVSLILFFGAIFVIIVLTVNGKLVHELREKAAGLVTANASLQTAMSDLESRQGELERAKSALEQKNGELDKTLEEFYTYRLGTPSPDIKSTSENRKLKSKLDAIRKDGPVARTPAKKKK